MNVLVTGGAGYIGSHAVQRLLRDGHQITVLDNLYRGHRRALDLLSESARGGLKLIEADICNRDAVSRAVLDNAIDTVMHFAAVAYVGESVEDPLRYYRWNVDGLLSVLEACTAGNVQRLVFSSSCSTYGQPPDELIPIPEHCPQNPVSPYGRSKLMGEHIIRDYAESRRLAGKPFAYALLRYFNVAGSDRSGLLGEDHTPETHLVPVVLQVALGQRSHIGIFGTDYPAPDGTCVRDYVHVEDLADAHALAMQKLKPGDGLFYNVGIGRGYSVREIIAAARRVTGHAIPVVEQPRRPGDPPRAYADPAKIRRELGWQAQVTNLDDIIRSAWKWMSSHPRGYQS